MESSRQKKGRIEPQKSIPPIYPIFNAGKIHHTEFIMDILRMMAKKETDGFLAGVEASFPKFKVEDDDNFAAPWNNAVAWAEEMI